MHFFNLSSIFLFITTNYRREYFKVYRNIFNIRTSYQHIGTDRLLGELSHKKRQHTLQVYCLSVT